MRFSWNASAYMSQNTKFYQAVKALNNTEDFGHICRNATICNLIHQLYTLKLHLLPSYSSAIYNRVPRFSKMHSLHRETDAFDRCFILCHYFHNYCPFWRITAYKIHYKTKLQTTTTIVPKSLKFSLYTLISHIIIFYIFLFIECSFCSYCRKAHKCWG